jgi:hypothetical protein
MNERLINFPISFFAAAMVLAAMTLGAIKDRRICVED